MHGEQVVASNLCYLAELAVALKEAGCKLYHASEPAELLS